MIAQIWQSLSSYSTTRVFSSGNFSEIQACSLSTFINFSEKLFIYSTLLLNGQQLVHTVTKLPCQSIYRGFGYFFARNQDWASQNIPRLVVPLSFTRPLHYFHDVPVYTTHRNSAERAPGYHWRDWLWNWKLCSWFNVALHLWSPSCFSVGGSTAFASESARSGC